MKVLFVSNFQRELVSEETAEKISDFIIAHRGEYNAAFCTVFTNKEGSPFEKYLDRTDCMSEFTLPIYSGDLVLSKCTYGLPDKDLKMLVDEGCSVDIIGGTLENSVMAVAFQLFDKGVDFKILADYCFTSGDAPSVCAAEKLMKKNFGRAFVKTEN